MQCGLRGDAHGWSKTIHIEHRTFVRYLPLFFSGVCACSIVRMKPSVHSFSARTEYLLRDWLLLLSNRKLQFLTYRTNCANIFVFHFFHSLFFALPSFCTVSPRNSVLLCLAQYEISTEVKSRRCLGKSAIKSPNIIFTLRLL